ITRQRHTANREVVTAFQPQSGLRRLAAINVAPARHAMQTNGRCRRVDQGMVNTQPGYRNTNICTLAGGMQGGITATLSETVGLDACVRATQKRLQLRVAEVERVTALGKHLRAASVVVGPGGVLETRIRHPALAVQIVPGMSHTGFQAERAAIQAGIEAQLVTVVPAPRMTFFHLVPGMAIAGQKADTHAGRHYLVGAEIETADIMLQARRIAVAARMPPVAIRMQPGAAGALPGRGGIIAMGAGTASVQPAADSIAGITAVIKQRTQTAGVEFAGQGVVGGACRGSIKRDQTVVDIAA